MGILKAETHTLNQMSCTIVVKNDDNYIIWLKISKISHQIILLLKYYND